MNEIEKEVHKFKEETDCEEYSINAQTFIDRINKVAIPKSVLREKIDELEGDEIKIDNYSGLSNASLRILRDWIDAQGTGDAP